jgi:inorganic pyrophosphatase
VLASDNLWSRATDIAELPEILVERLRHYFATYKLVLGAAPTGSVERTYGRAHAEQVVLAAIADYREAFGEPPAV